LITLSGHKTLISGNNIYSGHYNAMMMRHYWRSYIYRKTHKQYTKGPTSRHITIYY